MAEWSIASVLKTEVLKGTGGSNPSLSALEGYRLVSFYFLSWKGKEPMRLPSQKKSTE